VFIIIGNDVKKIHSSLRAHVKRLSTKKTEGDHLVEIFDSVYETAGGAVIPGINGCPHILWLPKKHFVDLVHELVHICSNTFHRMGMPHDKSTDEAYAYLFGYLYDEITRKW
jgi:hypothetical protein